MWFTQLTGYGGRLWRVVGSAVHNTCPLTGVNGVVNIVTGEGDWLYTVRRADSCGSGDVRRRPQVTSLFLGTRPGASAVQWRRQSMKSGSAFRSQLYFQVGQTEGPKVPSYSQETRSARGGGVWGVPIWGSVAYTPEKFFQKSTFKSRVFCIFANWNGLMIWSAVSARQFRLGSRPNHNSCL